MRTLLATVTVLALVSLAACGGGDDEDGETNAAAAETGPCGPIEELDVLTSGQHADTDFAAADYETNPPAGGDHNPEPLQASRFYNEPVRLGEAVHLLEHGAVIGWTNGLSPADQRAVEEEFNRVFQQGYYQLATVENPDLEVPFALSAWGALQTCDEVDTAAIEPFVERWYASPKSGESALACQGRARRLPPC